MAGVGADPLVTIITSRAIQTDVQTVRMECLRILAALEESEESPLHYVTEF